MGLFTHLHLHTRKTFFSFFFAGEKGTTPGEAHIIINLENPTNKQNTNLRFTEEKEAKRILN